MATYRCAACGAVNRIAAGAERPACPRCRCALDTSGAPQPIDAAALVSVILSSPAPVLVDFTAPGASGSCLEGVASERAGEVLCLRVDTASEPAAAAVWSVDRTPTLVLFAEGSEVSRLAATLPPAEISRWVEQEADR